MDRKPSEQSPPRVDAANLRGARRFSLIIRPAKLVCESGEYLCVLRDISETGTKLRVFHDLPPDREVFLELANGERYAMERVWAADDYAGFRMAGSVDVAQFVVEPSPFPKRPLRLRLKQRAVVITGTKALLATLVDLSQQGARIETPGHLALDQPISLEVEGLDPIPAKVRWRGQDRFGLVFERTFRLDELARLAFLLQPTVCASDESCQGGDVASCAGRDYFAPEAAAVTRR